MSSFLKRDWYGLSNNFYYRIKKEHNNTHWWVIELHWKNRKENWTCFIVPISLIAWMSFNLGKNKNLLDSGVSYSIHSGFFVDKEINAIYILENTMPENPHLLERLISSFEDGPPFKSSVSKYPSLTIWNDEDAQLYSQIYDYDIERIVQIVDEYPD
jgi:hypothetical protein